MADRSLHVAPASDKPLSEHELARRRVEQLGYIDPRTCPHIDTPIRYKLDAIGRRVFKRQCSRCGASASSALKRQEVERTCGLIERVEAWDENLASNSDNYYRLIWVERDMIRSERTSAWWSWYNDYLASDEWRERRYLVIKRSGGSCEGCKRAPATQVHHLSYEHAGNEFLWELVAVCDDCHRRAHPDNFARPTFDIDCDELG